MAKVKLTDAEKREILQETEQNKIKMIYIDPPYNTGNDSFIYPDRFKEEKDDYELRGRQPSQSGAWKVN